MTTSSHTEWPKRIRVDRKIVNLLSRSLYADFPRVIREMLSNSYDADATSVKIDVDLRRKEVLVEDNGNGMSTDQFDKYLRIAGEKMEGARLSPKFQRERIGRFGVGFLASFPFCDRLEVTSKREGSELGFTANIPAARFVRGMNVEEEVSTIPVDGYNEAKPGERHQHYTKIRMVGLNSLAEEYFRQGSIRKRATIEAWDGMKRLQWQLCENLPLDFSDRDSALVKYLPDKEVGIEVWFNGKRLFRNDPVGQLVESSGQTYLKIGNLEFRYAIVTNWSIIKPVEARGLKIRVNNVGVGPRTYLDIEKEVRTFSRLNWLTGEIHVLRGLDESLALNRDTFTWSSDYQALKEHFHKVLTRTALWVERVASTEKKLIEAFSGESATQVLSPTELVSQSLKTFSNAGFEIVHKGRKEFKDRLGKVPVVMDKFNKIVTVIDGHPSLAETIAVPRQGVKIRYEPFDGADRTAKPIRLSEDGIIEVNSAYPIFSGKTKGNLLRRVHLIAFMAKQVCRSADEMYEYLVEHLRKEFE